MKTKLLLFISILCLSIPKLIAQDRVNKQALEFLKSSDSLTNVTGWAYNEQKGKWVEHKNFILDSDDPFPSLGLQNFTNITAKTFNINNKNYVALIIKYWEGYFQYPALKKGYVSSMTEKAVIFDEKEYDKIKNLKTETVLKVLKVADRSAGDNDEAFMGSINRSFDRPNKSSHTFPIRKAENGNIRFFLPGYHSKYSNLQFDKNYFETDPINFSKLIIK